MPADGGPKTHCPHFFGTAGQVAGGTESPLLMRYSRKSWGQAGEKRWASDRGKTSTAGMHRLGAQSYAQKIHTDERYMELGWGGGDAECQCSGTGDISLQFWTLTSSSVRRGVRRGGGKFCSGFGFWGAFLNSLLYSEHFKDTQIGGAKSPLKWCAEAGEHQDSRVRQAVEAALQAPWQLLFPVGAGWGLWRGGGVQVSK